MSVQITPKARSLSRAGEAGGLATRLMYGESARRIAVAREQRQPVFFASKAQLAAMRGQALPIKIQFGPGADGSGPKPVNDRFLKSPHFRPSHAPAEAELKPLLELAHDECAWGFDAGGGQTLFCGAPVDAEAPSRQRRRYCAHHGKIAVEPKP